MHLALESLPVALRRELKQDPQPAFVTPMKATLTDDHFDDPDWLYERKLDGVRCLIVSHGGEVTLYSRNQKRINASYPEIFEACESWGGDFIVDGELVAFSGKVTDFSRMQSRIHVRKPDKELLQQVPVFVYLFDILFLDGYDLRELPLRARKKVLKKAFTFADPVRYLPHRNEKGVAYLHQACARRWEGVIAKDGKSVYETRRSRSWLKFKCHQGQELVIGGYTEPQGSRVGFGALLLGYYQDGELCYAGRVGTGFNTELLRSLHRRLAQMKRQHCPFAGYDESVKGVTWVNPQLVGEVGFTEWTGDGRLRHPRFLGLREDKAPEEVVREAP